MTMDKIKQALKGMADACFAALNDTGSPKDLGCLISDIATHANRLDMEVNGQKMRTVYLLRDRLQISHNMRKR